MDDFRAQRPAQLTKMVNTFFSNGLYKNSRCNRGVTYKEIFINYVFSSMAGACGAHRIKTAIAANSSPVPTAHSTFTSRTRVPGPTFCCLGGGPVSSPALMASRFRVPSAACGFGAYSRSVDPNLPLFGTGSQFDTLSAGLRSNLSVFRGEGGKVCNRPHLRPCCAFRRRSLHSTVSRPWSSCIGNRWSIQFATYAPTRRLSANLS